jgi:hypothetical protein
MLPASPPKQWVHWGQPGVRVVCKARVSKYQRTPQMSRLAKVDYLYMEFEVKKLLLVGQVFIIISRAKF